MDDKLILDTIKEVGFDFHWDEKKVWALDVSLEEIPMSELEWHFDIPFWAVDDRHGYGLKPIDVVENPENYKYQYDRTMESDLSYPIDIMENKGCWLILDGLHRLVKARILGHDKVIVRKISRSKIPEISKIN